MNALMADVMLYCTLIILSIHGLCVLLRFASCINESAVNVAFDVLETIIRRDEHNFWFLSYYHLLL